MGKGRLAPSAVAKRTTKRPRVPRSRLRTIDLDPVKKKACLYWLRAIRYWNTNVYRGSKGYVPTLQQEKARELQTEIVSTMTEMDGIIEQFRWAPLRLKINERSVAEIPDVGSPLLFYFEYCLRESSKQISRVEAAVRTFIDVFPLWGDIMKLLYVLKPLFIDLADIVKLEPLNTFPPQELFGRRIRPKVGPSEAELRRTESEIQEMIDETELFERKLLDGSLGQEECAKIPWPPAENPALFMAGEDSKQRRKKVQRALRLWHWDKYTQKIASRLGTEARAEADTRVRDINNSLSALLFVYEK